MSKFQVGDTVRVLECDRFHGRLGKVTAVHGNIDVEFESGEWCRFASKYLVLSTRGGGKGMTLPEAIKKSLCIRRKNNPLHSGSSGDGWVKADDCFRMGMFTWEDIIATDWEARPESDTLTKIHNSCESFLTISSFVIVSFSIIVFFDKHEPI